MRIFENKNLIQRNFMSNPGIVLTEDMIRGSVSYCYETLDMIDYYLVSRGSGKLSRLLDKANLSSIIGNLLCSGLEQHSGNITVVMHLIPIQIYWRLIPIFQE